MSAAFRVIEHGTEQYFQTEHNLELLDTTRLLRDYLQLWSSLNTRTFAEMFPAWEQISTEEFHRLAAVRMESTGEVTGAVSYALIPAVRPPCAVFPGESASDPPGKRGAVSAFFGRREGATRRSDEGSSEVRFWCGIKRWLTASHTAPQRGSGRTGKALFEAFPVLFRKVPLAPIFGG